MNTNLDLRSINDPAFKAVVTTIRQIKFEEALASLIADVGSLHPAAGKFLMAVSAAGRDGAADLWPDKEQARKVSELCVISILTSQASRFSLSMHVYLGLLAGLEPEHIASAVTLAGMYNGADDFGEAVFTLKSTLLLLESYVQSLSANEKPHAEAIPRLLVQAFSGVSLPRPASAEGVKKESSAA